MVPALEIDPLRCYLIEYRKCILEAMLIKSSKALGRIANPIKMYSLERSRKSKQHRKVFQIERI